MIELPAKRGRSATSGQALGMVMLFGLLAIVLGLVGALFGWVGEVIVISLTLPVAVIVMDYRHGIVLSLMLLPYVNSPLIPQAGVLSPGNVVILGVVAVFLLRWVLSRIRGHSLDVPVDRELIWLYWLPITALAGLGSLHLGEIPRHFLLRNNFAEYGLATYWGSLYLKQMLLVVIAIAAGAAVVERGSARRFVVAMVMSGLLFVMAIVSVIAVSGAPLAEVMSMRESLRLIGRHNNEAGVMLLGVLGPVIFMREMSTKASLRVGLLVLIGLLVVGVLLTGSRGAFVGMLVMSAWYLWRFRRVGTALLALTFALIGVALAPEAVRDRLMTGLDSDRSAGLQAVDRGGDELTAGRIWIYELMIPDIVSSPLVGRGLASTQWSTPVKNGIYRANHPHNLYLEVLLDGGLIGFACMALFCRFVWRRFVALGGDERLSPEMRGFFLGSAAGLLGMLAYGASNGHYYPAPEQLYFWISFGLAAGFARRLPAMPDRARPAGYAARPYGARRPMQGVASKWPR